MDQALKDAIEKSKHYGLRPVKPCREKVPGVVQLGLRCPTPLWMAIKTIAFQRGMSTNRLFMLWLAERLEQELSE